MRLATTAALLALLSTPALAQAPPKVDCANDHSTPAMAFCAEIQLKRADAELNVVWREALGAIDKQDQMSADLRAKWAAALRNSQRAWIAFRDADCNEPIGYEWYGGTGLGLAMLTCQIDKTKARTKELRDRYLDQSGENSP